MTAGDRVDDVVSEVPGGGDWFVTSTLSVLTTSLPPGNVSPASHAIRPRDGVSLFLKLYLPLLRQSREL